MTDASFLQKLRTISASRERRQGQWSRRSWPLVRKLFPKVNALGVEHEGMTTFCHARDKVLTYSILAKGTWQKEQISRTLMLLRDVLPREGVFVNVGANIGTTLLYAMRSGLFGSAIAFEPNLDNFRLLSANVAYNGLKTCTLVQAAVSNEPGTLVFEKNLANHGDYRVVQAGLTDGAREREEIRAVTLSDAVRHAGVEQDVSLVWIDVQGHELAVLSGARDLLARGVHVVMEFSAFDFAANGTLDDLIALLSAHFSVFHDLGGPAMEPQPVAALHDLAKSFHSRGMHTDILLSPRTVTAHDSAREQSGARLKAEKAAAPVG